jgi:thiamine-monophosphate kinase
VDRAGHGELENGELSFLARLEARLTPAPPGQTWIGDDAAVVRGSRQALLVAADAVVAGVHADLALCGLDDLGWKALAVNLSDLAAMGAGPAWAVVTVCAPPGTDLDLLYDGLLEAAATYRCPVVGGDLSSSPCLVVSVTVGGTMPTGAAPVLRSGAAAGDSIWLTGAVGASAAGLAALRRGERSGALVDAHRRPQPLLAAGRAAAEAGATAMIDVSDGFALDLWRLARASGVGVQLEQLPVAPGATAEQALGGGEDYQLVFTAPPEALVPDTFRAATLPDPIWCGRCTAAGGTLELGGEPLPVSGWEHRL